MSRLGEDTNTIDGTEYEKMRVEQAKEYKSLVEILIKG